MDKITACTRVSRKSTRQKLILIIIALILKNKTKMHLIIIHNQKFTNRIIFNVKSLQLNDLDEDTWRISG